MLTCYNGWVVGIAVLFIFIKIYIKLTTGVYKGKERLDGKTIIVTGASAGLGKESARDFAGRGARVIMLCRDMTKGERVKSEITLETGNNNLVLKHINFASLTSVRNCAREILSEESRIDVLLNNAGTHNVENKLTDDGMNLLMQSNHFGPFLFTNILLAKLKESAPSRIVNVSSLLHKMGTLDLNKLDMVGVGSQQLYCNTKLANIHFTTVLAKKLHNTGVSVNSVHPGVIFTELHRSSSATFLVFWRFMGKVFFKDAKEGAQTQIMLCVSPSVINVTGEHFSDCKPVPVSKAGRDSAAAAKLWEISEKAVQLRNSEKYFLTN